MSRFDRNKDYKTLTYEKKNIKGKLTKYDILLEKNELLGHLNDLLKEEFGLSNSQFKTLINEGFLKFDYDELIKRYHSDLLCMYEEEIEEDYKEQLADERWYYGIEDDEESYKDNEQIRAEYGVSEHMFH